MSNKNKALKDLENFCASHNHRLTEPRIHVLQIISASKTPLTAYEVLEALGKKIKNPKPPTAYRALEFLSEHGFVHRIESLNAYISCAENHKHAGSQFLLCDSCGRVEEAHLCSLPQSLQTQAAGKGFTVARWNVELHGRCGKCS